MKHSIKKGKKEGKMSRVALTALFLTLVTQPGLGEDFQLLVFGGYLEKTPVRLFPSLVDRSCEILDLPQKANYKPFGGFMEGNVTICTGGIDSCYKLVDEDEELQWSKSFDIDVELSSFIATFDFNSWSFMGGTDNTASFFTWSVDNESFEKHELGFQLGGGACSARKNQTHAIISKGTKNVFWYEENGQKIQKWEEPEDSNVVFHAACGSVFNTDFGNQFVITGGLIDSEIDQYLTSTELFDFNTNKWIEGKPLPRPISHAASLPIQNSFILVGACDFEQGKYLDTVLKYEGEEGWMELQITLHKPDINVGAMRMPKEKLKCP